MPHTMAVTVRTAGLFAAILLSACSSPQQRIEEQSEQLESLGATTQAVAEGWLAGHLSDRFTRTALEQTFAQVEQARAVLVAKPQMLLDARAARLSQQAEQLSRLIAQLVDDVSGAERDAVRRRLTAMPIVPETR